MTSQNFKRAIELIDRANAQDPHLVFFDGRDMPRELVYSYWLTEWVQRLCPEASEPLLLAARSQHIERWKMPRALFPRDRAGYLLWRKKLAEFHAKRTAEILSEAGCDQITIERVMALNLKKNLKSDVDMQHLEDALCLVFLERQFQAMALEHPDDKMIAILKKTWSKMSEQGRALALKLKLSPSELELITRALH